MHFSMISVPYTEYLKFRKNGILYTRILTKKYPIPELKWPEIPYTQNPWPGLTRERGTYHHETRYPCFVFRCILVSYLIYTIVPINYSPHVGFRRYKRKLDLSTIGLSRSFLPIELKIQMPDMIFEWNLNRFLGNSSWVSFMYIFLKKVLNLYAPHF